MSFISIEKQETEAKSVHVLMRTYGWARIVGKRSCICNVIPLVNGGSMLIFGRIDRYDISFSCNETPSLDIMNIHTTPIHIQPFLLIHYVSDFFSCSASRGESILTPVDSPMISSLVTGGPVKFLRAYATYHTTAMVPNPANTTDA